MANENEVHAHLKDHQATYRAVIGMLKYGALACAVLVALVVYLIAS